MIVPDAATREAIRNLGRFEWEKTWTFWPRRCRITKRRMRMFSTAYKGVKIIRGPDEDMLLIRWLSSEAYTFEKLVGRV